MYLKNRINELKALNDRVKKGVATIHEVNDFWNAAVSYKTDQAKYGVIDYWQTPMETLVSGDGDCEDIAIAKFFTLLGFYDVYLAYCSVQISKEKTERHMTCIVKKKRLFLFDKEINLDIQNGRIKEIYRFNLDDIYLMKNKGKKLQNKAMKISKWADLLIRFNEENEDWKGLVY